MNPDEDFVERMRLSGLQNHIAGDQVGSRFSVTLRDIVAVGLEK